MSLVDDVALRLQRQVGLVPAGGLGVFRRAVFFALLTWLPLAAWALYAGRILPGSVDEPLLVHFGVHVRFLLAVPALILGEAMAHRLSTRLIPHFLTSGMVPPSQRGAFVRIVAGVARLRDRTLPWVLIAVLVIAWTIVQPFAASEAGHEAKWASSTDGGGLGFGGWWFMYVSRPIFGALLAAWVWRLALVFVLLKRVARLELSIVPTHSDGAGGLGFVKDMPKAFSLMAFAVSAVVSSRLAHDVIYHDVSLQSLQAVHRGLRGAGRRRLHRTSLRARRAAGGRQASRPPGIRRPGGPARTPGPAALDPGRNAGGRRALAGPGDRAGGRHRGPLRGGGAG